MGSDHRISGILVALGLSLGGCRKTPPPPQPSAAPPPSTTPDRLAPGELPPGQETAYELVLPRGGTVDRRFGSTIYCSVPLSVEGFANWVRQQSDDAEALVGPNGTIFTAVRVKGAPVGHHLRVEISTGSLGASAVVVDKLPDTPPPQVVPTSNEEVMKKAGLTPDGKWLDPKHLE